MSPTHQFLASLHFADHNSTQYNKNQIGANIEVIKNGDPLTNADIIILGCGEQRGAEKENVSNAPDKVRAAFYKMYQWHKEVKIADAGNLLIGDQLSDSHSCLTEELYELIKHGKKVILIGGSHDLTTAQYKAYQKLQKMVNISVLDAHLDIQEEELVSDNGFLMDMLTSTNNYVRHINLIGFQSYYTNPEILQTLDNLRFDCFRLGNVRHDLDSVEPELRGSDILSIDLKVLRASEATFMQDNSPNGLMADELCQLVKYAAMSDQISSVGFYGWDGNDATSLLGAETIAQAMWYFIDGVNAQKSEADLDNNDEFDHYKIHMTEQEINFKKSKRTNRWWMEIREGQFVPCTYEDYFLCTKNQIPERWYRVQERVV